MTYVALSYIGGQYSPGEIIRENLPEQIVEWLLRSGAIRAIEDEPETVESASAETTPEPVVVIEEESAEEACPEDEEEVDDEAEAPEIDVMDGLVSPPSQTSAKRKKGGKRR